MDGQAVEADESLQKAEQSEKVSELSHSPQQDKQKEQAVT
jgi:hypothetical protein